MVLRKYFLTCKLNGFRMKMGLAAFFTDLVPVLSPGPVFD